MISRILLRCRDVSLGNDTSLLSFCNLAGNPCGCLQFVFRILDANAKSCQSEKPCSVRGSRLLGGNCFLER